MHPFEKIFYHVSEFYHWSQSVGDKRVENWPLMKTPWPTLALFTTYLIVVLNGSKFMKKREPFQLRGILVVYNFALMILNAHIGVQLARSSYHLGYSWYCQPVDYSLGFHEMNIASALWWYYISKAIEFADTVFFILRKKTKQLTFLHVYHHSTMFFLWWIGVKYVAGGSSFLAAMINSFVHAIMYLYYGLSSFGSRFQKYLWWKKYLTCIQMVQFSGAGLLGLRALIYGCDFPLWMQYALVVYMLSFIFLFGQFYVRAYRKGGKRKSKNH